MELESLSRCLLCESNSLDMVDAECNIARCSSCGFVFDNPRPSLQELVGFYSRPSKYDPWLAELELRDQLWRRRLKLILPYRKEGSLLDVGAGIGQLLSLAKPHFDEVYGTEVSASAVYIAKKKYGVDLFGGTLDAFNPVAEHFDNISLFHVLEHVPDPVNVLRTCHSLLTENGILIIAVPNEVVSLRASLKRRLVRAGILKPRRGAGPFGLQRIRLTEETQEIHLSHFTPIVLRNLLRSVGFKVVNETLDPHYVRTTRMSKLAADIYYSCCLLLRHLLRRNLYDAMLVIAQKESWKEGWRVAA